MIGRRVLAMLVAMWIAVSWRPAVGAEEGPRFDVLEIRVVGNTLLARVDIEQTVYPFLGDARTFQDVEAARAALEQRYRDAGYPAVMVNIPEQDVNAGVVRLEVREGRIEQMRISGSRYYSLNALRALLPALDAGVPLHTPTVQRQIDALNATAAGRSVAPVLRPGRTPGTVEVELKVQDELPLHGAVELNNRAAVDTSDLRAGASLSYDNLWQRAHSFGLGYQTAPEEPDESRVLSATYLWRFADAGAVLVLYGVRSDSDTTKSVGELNVLGKGNIYGVSALLPRAGAGSSFTLGLEYKDMRESTTVQGADTHTTPISYPVASFKYGVMHSGERGRLAAGIALHAGVRVGDADRVDCYGQELDEFLCKRYGAHANFVYLRGDADYTRELPFGTRAALRAATQVANEPLISDEQFSAGGATSVRGYYESQAAGDSGVHATLELHSPNFGPKLWSRLPEFRALLFADGAALRVIDALPGETRTHELASAGIGLRGRAFDGLTLELDAARVFHAADGVEDGDMRVHFRIEYAF